MLSEAVFCAMAESDEEGAALYSMAETHARLNETRDTRVQ